MLSCLPDALLKKKFFSNFFFRFPGKSTSEKTIPPKKIGVRHCLVELGVSEGPKTKWGLIYFFCAFRVNRPRRKRFRRKKIWKKPWPRPYILFNHIYLVYISCFFNIKDKELPKVDSFIYLGLPISKGSNKNVYFDEKFKKVERSFDSLNG